MTPPSLIKPKKEGLGLLPDKDFEMWKIQVIC